MIDLVVAILIRVPDAEDPVLSPPQDETKGLSDKHIP
jgi:hypothetical protein